jgi:hypothetical protein
VNENFSSRLISVIWVAAAIFFFAFQVDDKAAIVILEREDLPFFSGFPTKACTSW